MWINMQELYEGIVLESTPVKKDKETGWAQKLDLKQL